MHHVDLVVDPDTDLAVREAWRRLEVADLPSLARHRSPSNRPHTTLAMTRSWPDGGPLDALRRLLAALPMTVVLGAPLVFGHGPYVLALGVVPSQGLIALHRGVAGLLAPAHDHLRPGAWTPHVTLANRLAVAQVGPALEVLAEVDLPAQVTFVAARHWDSLARLDEPLAAPLPPGPAP